ncbi:MAG: flagellar basal-body rod protein FlgF [Nitrospiraceae bacterium]|nr:MAG: flagellar basal-body rod protein FlgF [Nitrospiraceae bacterium]
MDRGIYPILSGALAVERRMQLSANNLANVNTAGFKQDEQAFRAVFARRTMAPVSRPVSPAGAGLVATRPGGKGRTSLCGALMGSRPRLSRGVFVSPAIRWMWRSKARVSSKSRRRTASATTRNGMFSLDHRRRLVTNLGYPVMGLAGELTIPPGTMHISGQGAIQVDGRTVGTIKVVEFPEDAMPTKQGEGLFVGEKVKVLKNPQIQVGHLEESNVNAIGEMVNMIEGMRMYESAQKLIQAFDRMAEVAIQDMGRVG